MANIVIFTGAGISKASGIPTFRDIDDGLYNDKSIQDMATVETLSKNPKLLFDMVNELRVRYNACEPNESHKALALLESNHEVTIITQNVDGLHEKAGSSNVLHLHGILDKGIEFKNGLTDNDEIYDLTEPLMYGDKIGDKAIRPYIVLFGEYPFNINKSIKALSECDILLIIGTSLTITYIPNLLSSYISENTRVIYLDPQPNKTIQDYFGYPIEFIEDASNNSIDDLLKTF